MKSLEERSPMKTWSALLAVFAASMSVSAWAQDATPVSEEVRGLVDELQAGEHLTPPVDNADRPAVASESEPDNNNYGTAGLVAIDGKISGTIGKTGDVDWWRVRAPKRGALHLASTLAPPEIDLAVRLLNANGEVISGWVNAPAKGGALDTVFDVSGGGEYWLELRDGRNDASSETPYEISLGFTPVPEVGEPNDSYGAATDVPINTAISASILPQGDVDYIAVNADGQGELAVKVAKAPENLDLNVRLLNANGDVISGWVSALAAGGPLDAFFDLPAAGRYVLELRDGRNDARSETPFELALNLRPTGDRGEPNNSTKDATRLAFDDPQQAAILPMGDVDWYQVEAPAQGELTIFLTNSPENLDLSFRVLDANREVISGWYAPLAKGGENINIFDIPAPGSYLIEIRDGRNDQRSPLPFTVKASFVPTADTGEPNNAIGLATPLSIGEQTRANILPKGDADYYAVDVPAQGAMTVALTGSPENLDMSFRVLNDNLEVITGWFGPLSKGGDNIQVIDIGVPGRYYLEVRDGRNDERSPNPYQIAAGLEETGDSFAPNNAIGTAASIGFDDPVTATILPKGDVDWYRVDAGQAGVLRASISQSPENLDMSIRFLDANLNTISGWIGPKAAGGPVDAEVKIKTPGSYYLEVRDGRNDDRSAKPYRLTVTAVAAAE